LSTKRKWVRIARGKEHETGTELEIYKRVFLVSIKPIVGNVVPQWFGGSVKHPANIQNTKRKHLIIYLKLIYNY
jgi:hypothetical protein